MTREQFITHVEGTQKAFRRFLVALCCGDTQLADDIAQEAYIKAYLSCDSFNSPDKFNAWIFRIGYNTFIDHRRRCAFLPATTRPAASHPPRPPTTPSATRPYMPRSTAFRQKSVHRCSCFICKATP